MSAKKAKKVTPPTDMDAHNASLKVAEPEPEVTPQEGVRALTTAEVAEQLDTTPRTLRKFLRSKVSGIEPVGQGRRYALNEGSLPKLQERFEGWKAREAAARKAVTEEPEVDAEDEVEEVEVDPRAIAEGMTVAELRELLEGHGIDFPSKAKKAELIDIAVEDADVWA